MDSETNTGLTMSPHLLEKARDSWQYALGGYGLIAVGLLSGGILGTVMALGGFAVCALGLAALLRTLVQVRRHGSPGVRKHVVFGAILSLPAALFVLAVGVDLLWAQSGR